MKLLSSLLFVTILLSGQKPKEKMYVRYYRPVFTSISLMPDGSFVKEVYAHGGFQAAIAGFYVNMNDTLILNAKTMAYLFTDNIDTNFTEKYKVLNDSTLIELIDPDELQKGCEIFGDDYMELIMDMPPFKLKKTK